MPVLQRGFVAVTYGMMGGIFGAVIGSAYRSRNFFITVLSPRPAHQPFAFCLRDLHRNSVCPRDKALDLALVSGVISIGRRQPLFFFSCFEIVKDASRKRDPDSEP
jgi:hypothetical protein